MTKQEVEKEQQGLTTEQAAQIQKQFGKNELVNEKEENFFHKILKVISEPMFLLLIGAAVIYFILGSRVMGRLCCCS